MARKAVVLFNLGGPDTLQAVEPFLFNLFNDPAIIRLPAPFRFLLAKFISKRRAPIAREIYKNIGGKSPLVPETEKQADALAECLISEEGDYKIFIAMRYWHPRAQKAVQEIATFDPDEIILLPLYPQYSTATTDSSVLEFKEEAKKFGLSAPISTLCCYPDDLGFVSAYADLVTKQLAEIEGERPRLLFSAHGLPKKIVDAGDPYQWQVEQSVAAIVKKLDIPDLDYRICYQSRVGRLEWIGPSTDEEIHCAGNEKKALMVIPVAFVSEHSETLVELDIEYAELARETGVPAYYRIPTVDTHPDFIAGLARLVKNIDRGKTSSLCGKAICPKSMKACAQA